MRSLKHRVVVELHVRRKAVLAPMLFQRFQHGIRGPAGFHEAVRQAAMQADQVEDFDLLPALNDQSFDQISAVEFGLPLSHTRQIPALRRWRPTHSPPTIQRAASDQDATDRPQRRGLLPRRLLPLFGQFAPNRRRTEFAQRAGCLQAATDRQDQIFDRRRSGLRRTSPTARMIAPIDAIQPFVSRTRHPHLDRSQTHTTSLRDRSQRDTPTNLRHHSTTHFLHRLFEPSPSPVKEFSSTTDYR